MRHKCTCLRICGAETERSTLCGHRRASVLLTFSNLYYSLAPQNAENREDERDIFIAQKSGSDAFKLSCWLINAAALIFAIVYAVSREPACLTVSLTLIAASAALCIIYVAVSCYYYKHN